MGEAIRLADASPPYRDRYRPVSAVPGT